MFITILKILILIVFLSLKPSLSEAYLSIRFNWYPVAPGYFYFWFPYVSTHVPIVSYSSYPRSLVYPPVVYSYRNPLPNLIALGEAKKEAYFKAKESLKQNEIELKEIPPLKLPQEIK